MTRSTIREFWVVGVVLCVLGVLLAIAMSYAWWGKAGVKRRVAAIVRRPKAPLALVVKRPTPVGLANLAPLATVTVSSVEEDDRSGAEGVADGVPDESQWLSEGETSGAWLKLTWDTPVTISEIELFDRPSLTDNVTAGTLSFDDGSAIPVDALPPNGSPWRTVFRPKTVRTLIFRIDRAQGRNAGLAEIVVYGAVAK